jgi:hypothetical protein
MQKLTIPPPEWFNKGNLPAKRDPQSSQIKEREIDI